MSQEVLFTRNDTISLDSTLSHLLVEWGQWIDHDVVQTPQSPSTAAFRTGADCTHTCSRDTPCFPIQVSFTVSCFLVQYALFFCPSLTCPSIYMRWSCCNSYFILFSGKPLTFNTFPSQKQNLFSQIPLSDPRNGIQSCMPFFRSAPSCVAGVLSHRRREQLNAITSFVDASMVYGSSASLASALRNLSSPLGSMAINSQHSDQELAHMPFLPRLQAHLDPCGPRNSTTSRASDRSKRQENTTSCFQAGERVRGVRSPCRFEWSSCS